MTRLHNKNLYLLLLAYALVEISATRETNSKLPAKLADFLQHIPEAVTLEMNEKRNSRLYEQMMAKAEGHDLTGLIEGWVPNAERRSSPFSSVTKSAESVAAYAAGSSRGL